VNCVQCGAFQRFDKSGWAAALAFAHEIGDLAGPNAEGRFPNPRIWIGDENPHRNVGVSSAFSSKNAGSIQLDAAPGYPTCRTCHGTPEIAFEGNAAISRCPQCGDHARFDVPAEALAFCPALVAVVGAQHRSDRRTVNIQTQAGLVALHCPSCGASVRPATSDTVECTYCKAVAFLPARVRSRGASDIVEAPIFWLAMRGPSSRREMLERPAPATDEAKRILKKATGVFSRGLSPLDGIELAPVRPGLDMRQLGLTAGLTAIALAIGAVIVTLFEN
jgi:hypothetical protein